MPEIVLSENYQNEPPSPTVHDFLDLPSQAFTISTLSLVVATATAMFGIFAVISTFQSLGWPSLLFIPLAVGLGLTFHFVTKREHAIRVKRSLKGKPVVRTVIFNGSDTVTDADVVFHRFNAVPFPSAKREYVLSEFHRADVEIDSKTDLFLIECFTENIFKKTVIDEDGTAYGRFFIVVPFDAALLDYHMTPSLGDVYVKNTWVELERGVCRFRTADFHDGAPLLLLLSGNGRNVSPTVPTEEDIQFLPSPVNITSHIDRPGRRFSLDNLIVIFSTVGIMLSFFLATWTVPAFGTWAFLFIPAGLGVVLLGSVGINAIFQASTITKIAKYRIVRSIVWTRSEHYDEKKHAFIRSGPSTFMDVDVILRKEILYPLRSEDRPRLEERVVAEAEHAGIISREKNGTDFSLFECMTENIFVKRFIDTGTHDMNDKTAPRYGRFFIAVPGRHVTQHDLHRYLQTSPGEVFVNNIWLDMCRAVCEFRPIDIFENAPVFLLISGAGMNVRM